MAMNYSEKIKQDWEEFNKNKPLPNIMLLGATRGGKSSLINTVFGKEVAYVNDVTRGTERFDAYYGKEHGIGMNLTDTRGYELEDGSGESVENYLKAVQDKVKGNGKKPPHEQIHIVWYCVSIMDGFQPYDEDVLTYLLKEPSLNSRVCIALTKCDQDAADESISKVFSQTIAEKMGSRLPVFKVSNDPSLRLDLDAMMTWSADQLDDAYMKEAFVASQVISLDAKRKAANTRVGFFTTASGVIGATPIPMSQAAILTPLQVTMAINLTKIYGMSSIEKSLGAVVGDVLISNVGKGLAGELIKIIPGGQIVGGVINASVAAGITSALGFAISQLCYTTCKKIANGEEVNELSIFTVNEIRNLMSQFYKQKQGEDLSESTDFSQEEIQDYADHYEHEYGRADD